MGRSKPPSLAKPGSACSGFRSPDSRYSSACSGVVFSVKLQSGARPAGTSALSGSGPRSPPKPPSPRTKMVNQLSKTGSPLSSTVFASTTTEAPLVLS
jgi:hypothetical protein